MYKKYIYKNGRKLGPYYYESKRIGSKIKTVYIGSKPPKKVALHKTSKHPSVNRVFLTSFLLLISLLGLLFIQSYTGFVVLQSYTDTLDLNINSSQSYNWQIQNPGNLNYLKVSGKIIGEGTVKIYIKNNDIPYLIYDTPSTNLLTGAAIDADIYTLVDTSKKNKTKELEENVTTQNLTAMPSNITELVQNITPSEIVNKSEISQPNLNLTENPAINEFNSICVETCSLSNFTADSYTLLFELENASLALDNIEYSTKQEIIEITTQNVTENLTIPEQQNLTIENLTNISIQENLNLQNITNITSIENLTNLALENLTLSENITNITLEDIYNLSKLEIKNSKKQKLNYKIVKQEKDSLEIEIHGKNIKSMKFEGVRNLTELYLEELLENEIKDKQFKKIYAVNPTLLDFDNATLTIKATGNELYKCKDWNFTEQKCYGLWQSLRYITPNLDYTLTITKEDPAFGEIEISNATHLDTNYNFISNIYDLVKSKDNIWSEPIYNGQYVRVTFVQNLSNGNDITLYARNLYGAETTIEVYYENSNEKIVEFPLINIEDYYQIIFENLTNSYPTFDLKIKSNDPNAYLEFDHIIDPISSVTLNDPTNGNLVVYSSKWFWMNCTAGAQGKGDTPDSLWFEHNNTWAPMIAIPVNTATSTLNTSSTNPIDPFSYDTMYSVNVSTPNAGAYQVMCQANNTAGLTITSVVRKITVLQTNVTLNMSSLNLGTVAQNSAQLMKSVIVFSNGTNNDVNISCLTGSCSIITTNFTSTSLLDNQTKTAFFNCSTSTAGFFSANFTVNSTQYQNSTLTDTKQMNVSCSIIAETVPPNILIRNPSNNSVLSSGTKVYSNYTYGTDVNTIWYEFDSNNTNITITTGSNITFTNLQEIMYNISIYANDSNNNINSSFVNFSIRTVIPTAFNIQKNTTTIYTGTQVNFSANWTDNTGLSGYIFTWNNSGSWLNASFVSFVSPSTVSQNISNITANTGTYVCWRFFANDTSNNWNMTMANQCFTVSSFASYCSGNFNNSNVNFGISTNVECANESMNINGNITVLSGGNLTLKNITIVFQTTADGSNFINKTENGGLWIYDNDNNASTSNDASNITAENTNFEYDFWVYGNGLRDNFTLQNSIVKDAGYSISCSQFTDQPSCVAIQGCSWLTDCTGVGIRSGGLQLYNISNVVVLGNNISEGALRGLYLQYSTNNNLTNNTINTTGSTSYGIYLTSSSNSNTLQTNTITTNGEFGYVIFLSSSSNSNITGNTITTGGSSGWGIYLSGISNSNITGNTITTNGSTSYGIYLSSGSNSNTLQTNTITTNGSTSYGIYLSSSSNNNATSNTITTNGTNGFGIILSFASNSNTLQNNTITTNGSTGYGIYLDGSASPNTNNIISSNTINTTGSSGYGIYLTSSSNSNTLQTNTITTNNNLSYGAYLLNSDFNNLSFNTINSSNSDSMFLDKDSDNNTISSNTIKFSKYSGIRIQNSTDGTMPQNNTITNNNITNATNGISIILNSTRPFNINNTIENNNITFTANAIYISNSSNINISLGIIRNSTNGIVLFNSKQVNATNITFISNTYDFNITNGSALTSINNSFNKTVKVLDLSNFTIMWFAEVYVNDNQANTNVSVWNTTGVKHGNSTTNAQGLTPLFLLTELMRNNSANLTSNNPFNFTADNTTFFNSTSVNVDRSMRVVIGFTAEGIVPPNILIVNPINNSVIMNTTIHANYTYGTDANAIWYELDSNNTNITITTGNNITFNNLNYIIHNLSLFANDSYNNINASFVNFSIIFNQTHCGGSYNETDMTDWNITTDVKCVNEIIQVDGNITVSPGGNLTLINSTINYTAPVNNNSYILSVYPLSNGLWVYDSDNDKSTANDRSVITSSNNNYINVTIKDDVEIINSRLNNLGRTITNSFEITGNNVTRINITGNLIEGSFLEIITNVINGANISFNNFTSGILSQKRYSTIQNNNIKCLDAIANGCVRLQDLQQIIINNTIECSNLSNAFWVRGNGNSFLNNRISNCRDSYLFDLGNNNIFINDSIAGITRFSVVLKNISASFSSNNTFINVSGITENLTSVGDAVTNENSFFINYFLEVQVIDNTTESAINNANVTIYDRYNNLVKTLQTDSNGLTRLFTVNDYKKNNTADAQNFTTSFNDQNITVSIEGYAFNSTTSNVTSSRRATISLWLLPDITPPNILIVNPSNNSVLASGTKVYSNYTYGTDANAIWYELDSNNTNITITAGANITFNNLAKTLHNISLFANDSSNNINASFVNFSVKSSPPIITIRNPINNSVIANTTIHVNYTYSLDSEIVWYEFDSNNTNITIAKGSNITLNSLSKVLHNITLFTNDTVDNIGQSFINFSIKSSTPNLVIFNPVNNSAYADGTTKLTLNFSAADTSLDKIWFEYDSNNTNITITSNLTFDTSAGLHNITLWANDTANNFNMSYVNFSVAPIPSVSYCSGNFNNSKAVFNINSNVECANETMNIDGNITILSGGNLTFKNITIIFQTTADGSNFINKSKDGGLWIYDNDNNASTTNDASNISSSTAYKYDFWAFGNGLRDNFTLRNSIITDAGYSTKSQGIQLYNVSNVVVSGNNVSDGAYYGLYLQYSANNNLSNNTITTTATNGYGIYLSTNSNSNTLQSNTITTNGSSGYGIYLVTSSNSNTIQSNTITTSGSFGYGIYLVTSSNSIIQNNTITTNGSTGYGIYLDLSSNNNVTSNIITTSNTNSIGIYLQTSSNLNTLQSNTITTNGSSGYGIYLRSTSNSNTLQSNTITTNVGDSYGISLSSSSNNNATSNTITTSGSSGYGISLLTSPNSIIQNNTITTNGSTAYGIYLDLSSNNNVTSNIITTSNTLSYGAYFLTSDFNNLSFNTINVSNSDSIFINQDSDNNIISFNTIKFSKYSGIRIQNSSLGIMPSNNTIINNNITNATNGISIILNSTRPFNVNNTIENNNITFTTNAIYISNSSNINISLGIIRNSTNGIVLFNSKQINSTNITFTANTYDFNITNSSSLTSINNTFNKTVKVMDLSNFTIMWFAEVYVDDNQANTNVSVWNATGVKHGNSTTNSLGLTPLFLLTELMRNNSANLTSNNPFNFTADNTTFFNSTSVNVDRSLRVTIGFTAPPPGANQAPTVNNLTLTPLFPNTTINLNCSFIITDPNADTLTVNLTWYKNSTINKTYSAISVTNGTLNMHYLNNANTSKNDNWSCGIRPYDAIAWGNEVNSSIVAIQNSQPSTPALSSPADGNKTTNKTEKFYWNPSTDPDNDPITYTINISCWGGCSADNRLVNTTSINYTPAELKYFLDDNYYYNWTVKAIDTDANSSAYAAERNLSIISQVSISLPNSTILFGTRSLGDVFDTANNTPNPIVIQNDGNSYVNVNLSAQSMLFATKPNPSTNYRYKIDNTSVEAGSFNWSGSVTSWTNIPSQNNTAINLLNYSNANDTAEMDVQITVPLDEPPGNLTSSLILTGYYIAYYP